MLVVLALFTTGCDSGVRRARQDLAGPDAEKRIQAAKVLGDAGDQVSVPKLIELLADTVPDVRKACARALGRIGDSSAVRPLAELYQGERVATVADAAVGALVDIGLASVDPLIGLTRSYSSNVRAGAARALGKLRSRRAVDPLLRLLEDRDTDVRISAVYALRRIGDERGLEAIARLVEDVEQDVEGAAEKALSGRGYEEQMDGVRRVLRMTR